MSTSSTPRSQMQLGPGGRALWRAVTKDYTLDAIQKAQLLEACRQKDRLDKMDALLTRDEDVWFRITEEITLSDDHRSIKVNVSSVLDRANSTANVMKQMIAALRLPDTQTGKRPQARPPRGAQAPTVPGGKQSARDRLKSVPSA